MAAIAPIIPTGELFIALVVIGVACLTFVTIHSRNLPVQGLGEVA